MQEKWDKQQAKKSFLEALSKFQELCPIIEKTKQGHNCKYAPLDSIIKQIKSSLRDCGLSYRWESSDNNGDTTVTCVISHVNGHCETNQMTAKPDTSGSKNAIQAIGSTRSYLHRYTLIGALGIGTADTDTDGNVSKDPKQTAKVKLVPITENNFKDAVKYVKQYSIDRLKKRYSFDEKMENKLKEAAIDGI